MPANQTQTAKVGLPSHIPALDGVRGIAVLLVLFYHSFYWAADGSHWNIFTRLLWQFSGWGWSGVSLFFVLSGFLITGRLLDSKNRTDYYRYFYWARAFRILPVYVLLLVALWLHQGPTPFLFISAVFLSHCASLFGIAVTYPALWSLSVEENFYLFWPSMVRYIKGNRLVLFCAFFCIVEPVLRGYGNYLHWGESDQPWSQFDGLLWGALLAQFVRSRFYSTRNLQRLGFTVTLIAIAIIVLGMPYGILDRRAVLGSALKLTILDLFFFSFMALALASQKSVLAKTLSSRVLVRWGNISYSVYLLHCLVLEGVDKLILAKPTFSYLFQHTVLLAVARTALGFGLVYLLASLIYIYIEKPALSLKKRWYVRPAPQTLPLDTPQQTLFPS